MRQNVVVVLVTCLAALLAAELYPSGLSVQPPVVVRAGPAGFPRFSRVAVLVLENREYNHVIGARRAPYLTRLARRYSLARRYYAIGHPSLPNYLALTGGSTFGVRHDCNRCEVDAPSLVDQLNSAGISWKAYFESLPRTGFVGTRVGRYSKHLNPFVYYDRLTDSPADRSNIVPLRELARDLRRREIPRFMWLAPNLCHDSHYCSVRTSDRYASRLVPRLIRAVGPRGVVFVTWDEGTTPAGAHGRGGGHVALIAAGARARRKASSARVLDHYSLLRTLEAGLGLPALKRAGSASTPLLSALIKH